MADALTLVPFDEELIGCSNQVETAKVRLKEVSREPAVFSIDDPDLGQVDHNIPKEFTTSLGAAETKDEGPFKTSEGRATFVSPNIEDSRTNSLSDFEVDRELGEMVGKSLDPMDNLAKEQEEQDHFELGDWGDKDDDLGR